MLAPTAVHTAGVVVVNVTGRFDDAVAATATGDCAVVWSAIGPNVIGWSTLGTSKLWNTTSAGSKPVLPACSASTGHVPGPIRVIVVPFAPPAVHTVGVVVTKLTGSP